LGTPATDDHTTAIAGVVAAESDVIGNGCQECPFSSMAPSIWTAPGVVTDAAGAKAIMQASPASFQFQADGHYRQALDPCSYLLCADSASSDVGLTHLSSSRPQDRDWALVSERES
jgi:hypothetical protein